jgi:hypothetical protein
VRLAALQGAPVVAAAVVVAVIASGAVGFGPGSQRGGSNCGTATEVPGAAALNQGGDAAILSVSCRSAGNCSAGGIYKDSSGRSQAFVVNQKNGTWSTAEEVPGFAPLNQGGDAELSSVSCGSPGNCSSGGAYKDSPAATRRMWTAKARPGTPANWINASRRKGTEQAASVLRTTRRR